MVDDLVGLLKLAKESVEAIFNRVSTAREKPWEELTFALDKLTELVTLHVKAVAEVVTPLLNEGNLPESARRYDDLVNNTDFPRGYGSIEGTLLAVRQLPGFRDEAHFQAVKAVLDQLVAFRMAVFTPEWDSYKVSDAVNRAAKVAAMEAPAEADIAPVVEKFLGSFKYVREDASEPAPVPPKNAAELTSLLQDWFRSWRRSVQRASYGGVATGSTLGGLGSAISQLKMLRHA